MEKELITQRNPKSPIAEIFRTLRTNIQFTNKQGELKTILVTSTMPGEGKSWVSSNLAITFAQTGKRVLLIDSDMRKGRLAKLFRTEKIPGLSNLLSGVDENGRNETIDISRYIKQTEISNLFLIPTGSVPPNPAELLGAETTPEILEKLKEYFDVIILDGTPGLLVADAIVLSRIVDTTILVASYKNTKKEDLDKIKRNIQNVGGKIAGVVLNKMPIKSKEYLSTYYYGTDNSNKSRDEIQVERIAKQKPQIERIEVPQIENDMFSSKTEHSQMVNPGFSNNTQQDNKNQDTNNELLEKRKEEILSELNKYMEENRDKY